MPDGRLRDALAALAAALGVSAIALAIWRPGTLETPVGVHVAIGWSFAAAGYVAWRQRPANRTGLLMLLTGVVWFGRDFAWLDGAVVHHLSDLSQNVFLALVAHQAIVFPYGVARSRLERALVRSAYVLAFGGYLVSELVEATNDLLSLLAIVLLGATIFTVVERWRTADTVERRLVAPILWAGPPVLVVAAASIARDYLDLSLSDAGDTALDRAQLVYCALPAAFLAGVLRSLVEAASAAEDLARENARLQAELRVRLEQRRVAGAPAGVGPLAALTARELEVLALIAEGRTDRGIARQLFVTPKTVEAHVRSIFRKLDLPAEATDNRRVHAVLAFLRANQVR